MELWTTHITEMRGFPSKFDIDCFKCIYPIRVGDLVLRSHNISRVVIKGRGIPDSEHITGSPFEHAYHSQTDIP